MPRLQAAERTPPLRRGRGVREALRRAVAAASRPRSVAAAARYRDRAWRPARLSVKADSKPDPETGRHANVAVRQLAARALGIDQAAISKALHGHTTVAHGFRWRSEAAGSCASSQCSEGGARRQRSRVVGRRDDEEDEEDDDAADRRTPPPEADPSASDDDDERASGLGAPMLESVMSGAAALLRTSTRPEALSVGPVSSSASLVSPSADMTGLLTTLAEAAEAAEPDPKRPRLMSRD